MEAEAHGAPLLAGTIYGRAGAVDALRAHVDARRGGALALAGVAGIGKTRLALWAADYGREERRVVVEGRSVLGLAEPLGVVCDLVRSARRGGLEPPMRDPLAAGFPAQVLPELGAEAGGPATLGATFEAAARYLGALAGSRGALIVLEDLHWADATSVSLIPFLARALRGAPVRLLLTYRAGDDDRPAPALEGLRAEMRRSRLGDELTLGPLADDAAAAMLDEILGRPPAADVKAELLRLAGGNPFALEELARAVVESGWLDVESGRRRGTRSVEVPWTLAESIRARAERLDPADRELVAWAAAIGERFDSRLLIAASGTAPADVLAGMASLVRAGLVVEAPDDAGHLFAFRHALVHEALSQEGLAAQRRGRHERVLVAAEAMLAEGGLEDVRRRARAARNGGRRPRAHPVPLAGWRSPAPRSWAPCARRSSTWSGRCRCGVRRTGVRCARSCSSPRGDCGRGSRVATSGLSSCFGSPSMSTRDSATSPRRCGAYPSWPTPASRPVTGPRRCSTGAVGARVAPPGASGGAADGPRRILAGPGADRSHGTGRRRAPTRAWRSCRSRTTPRTPPSGPTSSSRAASWSCPLPARGPARQLILEAIGLAIGPPRRRGRRARQPHPRRPARLCCSRSQESLTRYATAAELVERHGLVSLQAFYLTLSGASLVDAGEWAAAERQADQATALVEGLERAEWVRNQVIWINGLSPRLGRGDLEGARAAQPRRCSATPSRPRARATATPPGSCWRRYRCLRGIPGAPRRSSKPYLDYAPAGSPTRESRLTWR